MRYANTNDRRGGGLHLGHDGKSATDPGGSLYAGTKRAKPVFAVTLCAVGGLVLSALALGGVVSHARGVSPGISIPAAVPNPDFWWAIPRLQHTGLPVLLPTWLPRQGVAGKIFDPEEVGGLPPITVRSWKQGFRNSAPGPGYTIGVGNVGKIAVPFVHAQYVPNALPSTLDSPFTLSTDGRDSPPVGITVVRSIQPVTLLGLPVAIGHGITARLHVGESGGSVGDFVTVSFFVGRDVVEVQYPGIAREDAVRIAESVVRVRLPLRLTVRYDTTRLTLEPLAGSQPAVNAGAEAWGFRYHIVDVPPSARTLTDPRLPAAPLRVALPALPNAAVITGLGLPVEEFSSALHRSPEWKHGLASAAGTVLLPSWLPSQYLPLVAQPLAWKTRTGYRLSVAPPYPYDTGLTWQYRGAEPSTVPFTGPTRRIRITPTVTGTLGAIGGETILRLPIGPDIEASVWLARGPWSSAAKGTSDHVLIADARQALDPPITVVETSEQPKPLPHSRPVQLPRGKGWLTLGSGTVQVTIRWRGHTYRVITRGPQASQAVALRIAQGLTPLE